MGDGGGDGLSGIDFLRDENVPPKSYSSGVFLFFFFPFPIGDDLYCDIREYCHDRCPIPDTRSDQILLSSTWILASCYQSYLSIEYTFGTMTGYLAGTLENLLKEGRGARAEAQDTAHQTCYQYLLIKQFLLSLQKSFTLFFYFLSAHTLEYHS